MKSFRYSRWDGTRKEFSLDTKSALDALSELMMEGLSAQEALEWMDHTFNVTYPQQGMLFAVGNQAKRPQVWQLLGVLRVDDPPQGALPL